MTLISNRRPLIVLVLIVLAAFGAAALTSTGGDQAKSWEGVQVAPPDFACTASVAFEEIPGMSLPFDLKKEGAVVVLFQGQFGGFTSSADARAIIRFTIDGVIVGSAVAVANDHGTGVQTFGFNAFSQPLASGAHTLSVLW